MKGTFALKPGKTIESIFEKAKNLKIISIHGDIVVIEFESFKYYCKFITLISFSYDMDIVSSNEIFVELPLSIVQQIILRNMLLDFDNKYFITHKSVLINTEEVSKEEIENFKLMYDTSSGTFWKDFKLYEITTIYDGISTKLSDDLKENGKTSVFCLMPDDCYSREAETKVQIYSNRPQKEMEEKINKIINSPENETFFSFKCENDYLGVFEHLYLKQVNDESFKTFMTDVNIEKPKRSDDKGN